MTKSVLTYTPVANIAQVAADSRAAFNTRFTMPIEFRRQQLKSLLAGFIERKDELLAAVHQDLRREGTGEYMLTLKGINELLELLDKETQPKVAAGLNEHDKCKVKLSPLGSCLVIGAWNFPMLLIADPVAGAIAAGNTVVIKPSEVSAHTAVAMTDLFNTYLDPRVARVVNGAAEETTVLLKERFDHIFYTGGTQVGKIVMAAAAKHLTPVVLELGGKSPVVITESTNLVIAAQRIAGTKMMNAGQVCIAPDYVLCPSKLIPQLVGAIQATWDFMVTKDPKTSSEMSRIVNTRQFDRLEKVLVEAREKGQVAVGGTSDREDVYIAPTILTNVSRTDLSMQEEIFGPILPIVASESVEEAIDFINGGESPLGLYVFTNDEKDVQKFEDQTRSGVLLVNDCSSHFYAGELPFGGVGHSGLGAYHGKYSMETFSHRRPIMQRDQSHL